MKKLIYSCVVLGLVFSACSRDEDNLFSQSAAERLQAEKDATIKQLCAAPNGWEMLYFPNPNGAGYAFLMEFKDNGLTQIAAKNEISCGGNLYKEQTSLWDIDFTQSVVLTFNSYNDLFHIFADPLSDGLGYEGDYEFVVQKRTENQISLKGKKHYAYLYLNRLSETTNWNDYFKQIDTFSWNSFCGNYEKDMYLFGAGDTTEVTYSNGVFTYKKDKVTYTIPSVISPTGLHCYTSMPNKLNVQAKDFVFNSDSSRLICTENSDIFFINKMTLSEFFVDQLKNKTRFTFMAGQSSKDVQTAYEKLVSDLAANDAQLKRVAYTAFGSTNAILIDYLVDGKLMQGYMTTKMQLADNNVSYYEFEATESITPLLNRFNSEIEGLTRFEAIFGGKYQIKSNITTINPSQLLLISTSNSGKYLMISADTEAL